MGTYSSEKFKLLRDKRAARLRILSCFYDSSPIFEKNNGNHRHFTKGEIAVVQSWKHFQDVIDWMHEEEIISSKYDYRNLHLDLWYLKKELSPKYGKKIQETNSIGAEKLLLHVVIQALLDVHSRRPCDMAIWNGDISPDSVYCTPTAHVCSQNAERFLRGLDGNFEEFIGVSHGCIYDLLKRIKKDPNYFLGSLCPD